VHPESVQSACRAPMDLEASQDRRSWRFVLPIQPVSHPGAGEIPWVSASHG